MFDKSTGKNKLIRKTGYLFSYFLFTTILYFILTFLNKIPETWNYFHIMGITLIITIAGVLTKKCLK